jgi:hypothetical protein
MAFDTGGQSAGHGRPVTILRSWPAIAASWVLFAGTTAFMFRRTADRSVRERR